MCYQRVDYKTGGHCLMLLLDSNNGAYQRGGKLRKGKSTGTQVRRHLVFQVNQVSHVTMRLIKPPFFYKCLGIAIFASVTNNYL